MTIPVRQSEPEDEHERFSELFAEGVGPARDKYNELDKSRDYVEEVLAKGGQRARAVACELMDQVRKATGITINRAP